METKINNAFSGTERKQVARIASAEKEKTTTAIVCISVAGYFVLPIPIFRRIRIKIEQINGASPGSI